MIASTQFKEIASVANHNKLSSEEPSKKSSISVALAASTPLLRHAFWNFASNLQNWILLGTASTPGAIVTLCRKTRPNVLLVDSANDPMGRLVKHVVAAGIASTVVVLVGPNEQNPLFVSSMTAFGVHGIVSQNAELPKIASAVSSAHYCRSYVDPELSSLAVCRSAWQSSLATVRLSPRELEVLRLVASGYRNHEIASQLGLSTETVRTHMKGCLRKLVARDRVQAVHTAYTLGLLTPPGLRTAQKVEPAPRSVSR